jgi:hypothetical protein
VLLLLLWKVLLTSLGGSEELQFYFFVQFPMKKVLLLLWKVLLTSLGGSEELATMKAKYRAAVG